MNQDVIIIVRHGKPSLSRKVRLTWSEFLDWWKKYDEGGIVPDQKVPEKIKAYAKEADVIVSSPLRRAVESARLASGREPDVIEPGLIEAALPAPNTGPLKMGPKSWGTFSRCLWYVGWSGGMESHTDARARAEAMCDVLAEHASGGKLVFVTAHGWFNRMVKGSLKKRGWKCVKQNGDLHWSHRRFERPTQN